MSSRGNRAQSALVRYDRDTALQQGGQSQQQPQQQTELSIDHRPHTAGSLLLLRSSVDQHNKQLRHRRRCNTTGRDNNSSCGGGGDSSYSSPAPRLVAPDDCCRYCELYQEDRIAAARHRSTSIVAWAQDVTRTMQDANIHAKPVRKRQVIRFLKYEPPGKPAGEEGNRRVPALPGKKKCELLKKTKMFGEDTVADVASNLAHLAVKFDSEYNGPPHGPSKVLVPAAQNRSARASAKRINGEAPQSARSSARSVHLTSDPMRMSSRSCSNELLNVITIDDAYRRHRRRMMSHRPVHSSSRRDDNDDSDGDTDDSSGDEGHYPEFCESRAITDGRVTETRAITDGQTAADQVGSRPTTTITTTATADKHCTHPQQPPPPPKSARREASFLRLRSDLTMRQTSPGSPMYVVEEEKYESIEDTPIDGPNETILRAIDGVIGTRNVTHNSAHTGLYRQDKASAVTTQQPESRRFQKLNRKLHKLIDMDYVPNRFSHRIKQEAKNNRKQPGSGNRHVHLNGVHSADEDIGSSARSRHTNENFLEMLMDMEKNGARMTESTPY